MNIFSRICHYSYPGPHDPQGPLIFMNFIFQWLQLNRVNWTKFNAVNYSREPAVREKCRENSQECEGVIMVEFRTMASKVCVRRGGASLRLTGLMIVLMLV